ncbi:MAG: hypothetical protein ACM3N4_09570 [Nitrososphaerota archaeon]
MTTSDQSGQQGQQYARGDVPFSNYVIAVLDTPAQAKAAHEALKKQGFAAADIVLSAPLRPSTPEAEREQGTLADPPTRGERLLTEEGYDQELYTTERERGHVVIQVRTPDSRDVDIAHRVLVAHNAHTIKRVGTWTRENLPSE